MSVVLNLVDVKAKVQRGAVIRDGRHRRQQCAISASGSNRSQALLASKAAQIPLRYECASWAQHKSCLVNVDKMPVRVNFKIEQARPGVSCEHACTDMASCGKLHGLFRAASTLTMNSCTKSCLLQAAYWTNLCIVECGRTQWLNQAEVYQGPLSISIDVLGHMVVVKGCSLADPIRAGFDVPYNAEGPVHKIQFHAQFLCQYWGLLCI